MPGTDASEPTPDNAGDEAARSNIVPFPGRFHPVAETVPPEAEDAAARLDRALLALIQTLAKQQEAIWAWRRNLKSLEEGMSSLTGGLCALDAKLIATSAKLKAGADENGKEVTRSSDSDEGATPAQEQPLGPSSD